MLNVIKYFPSVYYYSSRYDNKSGAFFHIIKYWAFLYSVFFFMKHQGEMFDYFVNGIYLLVFLSLYDLFCLKNDILSEAENSASTVRVTSHDFDYGVMFYSRFFLVLSGTVFFLMTGVADVYLSHLVLLSVFFMLHNKLTPKYRIATYFSLYWIKGCTPLLIGLSLNDGFVGNTEYMMFVLVFSLSYLPAYCIKKIELSNMPSVFSMTFIYKFVFLFIYAAVYEYMFPLVYTVTVTLLEKIVRKVKYRG